MTSSHHPTPVTAETAKRAQRKARRNKALELRKIGLSYRLIAKTLKISCRQAYNDVQRALEEGAGTEDDMVVLERNLTDQRLDAVITALHKHVHEGDYRAIDRWLRTCEIRRKLLRLDRPVPAEEAVPFEVKFIDSSVLEDEDEKSENTEQS
jgi:hypothetical protein